MHLLTTSYSHTYLEQNTCVIKHLTGENHKHIVRHHAFVDIKLWAKYAFGDNSLCAKVYNIYK